MDDHTRDELLARLEAAKMREERAREQLRAYALKIDEIRKTHGNPYYFSPRPADDPESEAFFTGYKSADPALRLMRDCRTAILERETIRSQLREAGFDIG